MNGGDVAQYHRLQWHDQAARGGNGIGRKMWTRCRFFCLDANIEQRQMKVLMDGLHLFFDCV
jgi:hypothetical protein